MVNARVVHVESKDVVAAATKFFPSNVFWSEEAVTTRDGMLYRYSTAEVVTAVENEGEEQ
jgi:Ser-tRNA(Ala) deacylase AlaX